MALYETGYPDGDAKEIKDQAIRSILENTYISSEEDSALRGRIRSAYEKFTGFSLLEHRLSERGISTMLLHGPIGHEKGSIIKDAAKDVAKMLDMNFVEDLEAFPGTNDFLFSAYGAGDYLLTEKFNILNKSRIGVSLFEGVEDASKSVQSEILSLANDKKFQSSSIGQHTTSFLVSESTENNMNSISMLSNKCDNFYFEDNVKDWLERESANKNDSIGLAGLNVFFKQYPESFAERVDKNSGRPTPFASPRSWSNFLPVLRNWMNKHEQNPSSATLSDLEKRASGTLGTEVGSNVAKFYESYA